MKYKITIAEVIDKEIPKRSYEKIGVDEDGKDTYGYVETGEVEIESTERKVYEQEKDYLDIGELAIFINRVK